MVLVTTVVAVVAVVLTGLVGWYRVQANAEEQERDQLSRQAEVLSRTPGLSGLLLRREQRIAGANGVELAVLASDGDLSGAAAPAVSDAAVGTLLDGRPVSADGTLDGVSVLVEGQPTPGGGAVVLVRPDSVVADKTHQMRFALVGPLLAGLLGAALAGALLARRLARPLEAAAGVAHRLAAGERGLSCDTAGPVEVAEVAGALNTLDTALSRSENRQRDFLLSVSHEIRTPLTTIRGYAEAIADGVAGADDLPAVGSTMLAETGRLERFVGDLLALARLEADDFRLDVQRIDLDELLAEAAVAWQVRCARQEVVLRVERPHDPVYADTDGFRVRQLLDGLADNALRVLPPGKPLVLALRREGPDAVLQVRDGGPGLTDDDTARAFERGALHARYRDTRPVGTGLGLAIAQRLAARLGGGISVQGTAPEGGASFTVTLPRAPE